MSVHSDQLADAWDSVTSWLADVAPESLSFLGPPETDDEIFEARADFACTWPEELGELFTMVNGSGDRLNGLEIFPHMPLLSLEDMRRSGTLNTEVMRASGVEPTDDAQRSVTSQPHSVETWSPSFVPFAESAWGDGLFVDARSGPAYGSVGRWLHADVSTAAAWGSLHEALNDVGAALRDGTRRVLGMRARLEDGKISWY